MSNTKKQNLRTIRLNSVDSDSNHELRLDDVNFRSKIGLDYLAASDHHPVLTPLNQSVEKHHSQHSCNSYPYDHAGL